MKITDSLFLQRHGEKIEAALGCYDRLVITGTLLDVAYPAAVQHRLNERDLRCFELGEFAEPLREAVRENAEALAKGAGLEIEYLVSKGARKEDRIAAVLAKRGEHPGLVHIFSAMERCRCFKPWRDKVTGRTGVRVMPGRCLHYYFYLIDEELGLCFVKVPTWLPFRLQIYFNQHQWLARQLTRKGITFKMLDNAFVQMSDWQRAQRLANEFSLRALYRKLNELAERFCPVAKRFARGYHFSLMQVEYALDIVFKNAETLKPIYEEISRQAVLTVRTGEVARFLGKRLSPQAQVQSDFHTRVEGTRIKHTLNRQAIKMYDKQKQVLRIECTTHEVTFFKHHRKVAQRAGGYRYQLAALKRSIYSLGDLRELLAAATRRYLEFVGELEDHSSGRLALEKITRTTRDHSNRTWRGFNLFNAADLQALLALLRGEHHISGLTNRSLQRVLTDKNAGQIGRILKRLRLHGLIRRIGRTYKYYVTQLGQKLLIAALKLKEHLIIPELQPTSYAFLNS